MTRSTTLEALAAEAISKYLTKATRYQKAVLKDRDPEALHQMRVGMRRLRTAMQVFEPVLKLPKAAREPDVAALGRKLSDLRDLDVIAELLRQYLPDLPEVEGQALQKGFKSLHQQRKRAFKQVKTTLKGDRYQQFKTHLKQWTEAPKCGDLGPLPAATMLPDLVVPLLSGLWLHPGWLIATEVKRNQPQPIANLEPDAIDAYVDHPKLHSLRKQVKRVRYQLQLVADQYGDRLDTDLANFQALQESLGNLQDSLVLAAFLDKAVPKWKAKLPTLKARLTQSRYQAWSQWQALQKRYLSPLYRDALRQVLIVPGAGAPQPATPKAKAATAAKGSRRKATTAKKPPRKTPARRTAAKKSSAEQPPAES
ncbi:MAG: CHAD domain-containing protein [Leptolyngbyaceae cyanobacterium]